MLPPGRTLGRYELVKYLASGGMAEVALARATGIEGFERYVVIKRIHAERSRDAAMVRMFLDEARLAASLHHANIVQVHDVGQDHGEYFIAMEYIHGEDLLGLLGKLSSVRAQLAFEHIFTIVSSVASALHYAHEQLGPDRQPLGLVHRDVSPSNILVAYDGSVKVVDFGIAKAAHRSTETHAGTLKGKISYMAPEQCRGKLVDRRSDVFALGIVLYELATVRRLFKAASDFMTMSKITSGNVPRPTLYRADMPPELEHIIMTALAVDPAQRFQTADEMRIALDQVAARYGLRSSTTALGDYMVSQYGRRPEPWLIDDSGLAAALEMRDFDVSGEGVVDEPSEVETSISAAQPGSPIDRAWRRATIRLPAAQQAGWTSDDAPTTASSRTPMGWAPAPSQVASRRGWWLGGGAVIACAVIAMVAIASRTPGQLARPIAKQPVEPPIGVIPVVEPPNETRPVEPPPVARPSVVEPPVAVPTVADAPPVVTRPPAKVVRSRKPRPVRGDAASKSSTTTEETSEAWNPDALFLKAPK